jgi:hypothetical protein
MSQQAQLAVQTQQKATDISSIKGSMLQRTAINTTITPVHNGILQRCSGGVECAACREKRLEKEGSLQRAAVNSAPANSVPAIVHDVLSSLGQPLDAGTRAFMEPRFGHDFSQVRVHTDDKAVKSAQAVNALAYTVGRDVVFGAAQYVPGTMEGRRLLAHELTHVVQQGSQPATLHQSLTTGPVDSPLEREADLVANAVGRDTMFVAGQYTPEATKGRRLLANELTHVIQQRSSGLPSTFIQRTVAAANIDCAPPPAAAVPIVGANPLGTLRTADSEAIVLLTNARDELETIRGRILAGEPAAWPTFSDHTAIGLRRIFRMKPDDPTIWTGTDAQTVHILIRRLEIVRNLLRSGQINYHCRSSTVGACSAGCADPGGGACCTAGVNAKSCEGIFENFLCDAFWGQGAAGRTYTVMHEPYHMSFGFIGDEGRFTNAHCYSRLAFWLDGRDAPADRQARCPLAP